MHSRMGGCYITYISFQGTFVCEVRAQAWLQRTASEQVGGDVLCVVAEAARKDRRR